MICGEEGRAKALPAGQCSTAAIELLRESWGGQAVSCVGRTAIKHSRIGGATSSFQGRTAGTWHRLVGPGEEVIELPICCPNLISSLMGLLEASSFSNPV